MRADLLIEEKIQEVKRGWADAFVFTVSSMAHFFGVLIFIYTVYLAKPGFALFPWHPTLMVLAFAVLMLEAILMFSPYSSLIPSASRAEKVRYHWILQVAALGSAILGLSAIYFHKERNKDNPVHFHSWHAKFGLASVILLIINCASGLGLLYPNSSFFNPSGVKLWLRKKLHAVFGSLVFLVAACALILSLYTNWFNKVAGEFIWYAMLALITVITSVVTNQVANEFIFAKRK